MWLFRSNPNPLSSLFCFFDSKRRAFVPSDAVFPTFTVNSVVSLTLKTRQLPTAKSATGGMRPPQVEHKGIRDIRPGRGDERWIRRLFFDAIPGSLVSRAFPHSQPVFGIQVVHETELKMSGALDLRAKLCQPNRWGAKVFEVGHGGQFAVRVRFTEFPEAAAAGTM
jgi:hypothetical protein